VIALYKAQGSTAVVARVRLSRPGPVDVDVLGWVIHGIFYRVDPSLILQFDKDSAVFRLGSQFQITTRFVDTFLPIGKTGDFELLEPIEKGAMP